MSVELWKTIFDWAAVVLVGLTFIAGAGALITGKVLSDRQSEIIASKDRQAALDSKAKDLQIATLTDRATKAEGDIATADKNAADANAKAEGFRADIANANESAEQARAQVATATAEAAKANLELARIKAPRSLAISSETLEALRAFPGTEYTFSGASADQESVDFLKQIDGALQGVGWKRVNPEPPTVIGVNPFGDDFRVTIVTMKGVKVEVGCAKSADELNLIPPLSWPMPVKLAGAVRNAVASSTVPSSDGNVAPSVGILKGVSEVIRISVGGKP